MAKAVAAADQPLNQVPQARLFGLSILGWGCGILMVLLPFHAFLSVYAGHLAGHQALWQSWKEVLLIVLGLVAAVHLARTPSARQRLRRPVNYWVLAFVGVGLIVSLFVRPEFNQFLFGLKINFEFLLAFVIAQLATEEVSRHHVKRIILGTGLAVAALAVLQMTLLPRDFLVQFGYSATTIAPYQLVDPQLDSIRVLSTLGGPNQLGSFLLIPLALLLVMAVRQPRRIVWWAGLALTTVALVGSYSRAAWLGALVMALVVGVAHLPKQYWGRALIAALIVFGGIAVVLSDRLAHSTELQYYLLHSNIQDNGFISSTTSHIDSLGQSLDFALAHPLGQGIGSAGPATFHGATGFIAENYYLQLAIETGWLGLAAFIGIIVSLAIALWQRRGQTLAVAMLGALAGISVINLFLPGWTDSSTAIVFWIAAGVASLELVTNRQEATRG